MKEKNAELINIFDFDGTLTTETWPKFWVWVKKFGYNGEERNEHLESALAEYRKTNPGDALETFFAFFNKLIVDNKATLTHKELLEGEKFIKYNPGVITFLEKSISKNYIISGGLKEFLEHLGIAKCFDGIYGTPVQHNENGLIIGIGEVMTDDKKILAICDILKKNGRNEINCNNVNFIGDGYSDAPAMRFVHNNGGKSIFVYQPNLEDELYHYNDKIYQTLNAEGIVDFRCIADFRNGSELSMILQSKN